MKRNRVHFFFGALIFAAVLGFLLLLHFIYPYLYTGYRQKDLGPGFRVVETGNVQLYTNVAGNEVEAVAWILNLFYKKFFQDYGVSFSLRRLEGYVEFWVFQTVEQLQNHFNKKHQEDLFNSGGYYDPAKRVIAIPWSETTGPLLEAVLHEGTHLIFDQFAGGEDAQWSPWFSEGLACYFGSSRLEGSDLKLGGYDPRFLGYFLAQRKTGKEVTLSMLLEAPYKVFLEQNNVLWYAASQLLVYYLLEGEGGRLRKSFFDYYHLEKRMGRAGILHFASVFGHDLNRFQAKWIHFLEGL